MAEDSAADQVAQLVADYHAAIYRYAYRLSGSQVDAEDLTQQVFLTAQQKLHQLRDPGKVRSWLYAVLRNCWFKSCRRREPVPATSLDLRIDDVAEELPDEPIDSEQLQMAIESLPESFRVVVMMFYFEGMPYREMAQQLNLPIGTVMSRLSRAKSQLRRRLVPNRVAAVGDRPTGPRAKPE